jgi:hypothetical protein
MRLLLMATLSALVLFAVATIAPSLLPGPAESSRSPAAVTAKSADAMSAPLSATLVLVPDFHPRMWTPQYSVPNGAAQPPRLPQRHDNPPAFMSIGTHRYVDWHEAHGGIPQGRQTVRLVLTGRTNQPVIITRIRPVIIERQPPLAGWWFVPEQGGGVFVRFVEANLDCPRHPAVLVVPNRRTGQITRRTTSIDLQVSRSEVEELEVTAFTNRSYVRWGLEVTFVADGDIKTLKVTDPRLRVNGEAVGTLRTFTDFPRDAPQQRQGLVRTPEFDTTRQELRSQARVSASLCR